MLSEAGQDTNTETPPHHSRSGCLLLSGLSRADSTVLAPNPHLVSLLSRGVGGDSQGIGLRMRLRMESWELLGHA